MHNLRPPLTREQRIARRDAFYGALHCCLTGNYEQLRLIISQHLRVCLYNGYLVTACELDLNRAGKFIDPITGEFTYCTCVQLAAMYGHDSILVVLLTTPLVKDTALYYDVVEPIRMDEIPLSYLFQEYERKWKSRQIAAAIEGVEFREKALKLTREDMAGHENIILYPTYREAAGRGFVRCSEYLLAAGFPLEKTVFRQCDLNNEVIYGMSKYMRTLKDEVNIPPSMDKDVLEKETSLSTVTGSTSATNSSRTSDSFLRNSNVNVMALNHQDTYRSDSSVSLSKSDTQIIRLLEAELSAFTESDISDIEIDLDNGKMPRQYTTLPLTLGNPNLAQSQPSIDKINHSLSCCYLDQSKPLPHPRADPMLALSPSPYTTCLTVPEARYQIDQLLAKHRCGHLFARDLIAERFIYQDQPVIHQMVKDYVAQQKRLRLDLSPRED